MAPTAPALTLLIDDMYLCHLQEIRFRSVPSNSNVLVDILLIIIMMSISAISLIGPTNSKHYLATDPIRKVNQAGML